MTPYYSSDGVSIYHGNVLDVLPQLPAGLARTCVTSPPYWGLRDYGTAEWAGGDPACDHGVQRWEGPKQTQGAQSGHASKADKLARERCERCGAVRVDCQLGLEPTPEQYVANMVAVFREVRRVLTDDGTLWLNLGDSFWGGKGANGTSKALGNAGERGYQQPRGTVVSAMRPQDGRHDVLKPKDLIGIPWRVTLALQADGWYLRSDIIWHKPNPMPESVTDRPTKSHEYLFLLAKSDRYYYDHAAIAEPIMAVSQARLRRGTSDQHKNADGAPGQPRHTGAVHAPRPYDPTREVPETRNKRTVWTVQPRPYPGAHFATYPPELIEPCVKAGSAPGDTVLDPFNGSGTTGEVAQKWGRRYVGVELNRDYIELSKQRFVQRPLFGHDAA